MPTPARLAFPAMLAGSIALAFGPWLVRSADVAPIASASWRLALAVVPLALLARALRQPVPRFGSGPGRLPLSALVALAVAGLAFAADLGLWHLGIARTTMANATLMGNSASFLLPAYGFVVARRWPGRAALLALVVAACGIGLLLGRSADVSATHLTGDLLCVTAGAAYAVYFIAVDRVRSQIAPIPLLLLATIVGALGIVPVALVEGNFWPHDWTPLVALALGSQVFGQGMIIFAVGYLPPLVIGLTLLVQPAIAATIGSLRYGEVPGPYEIAGMTLVALALVLVRLPSRVRASAT